MAPDTVTAVLQSEEDMMMLQKMLLYSAKGIGNAVLVPIHELSIVIGLIIGCLSSLAYWIAYGVVGIAFIADCVCWFIGKQGFGQFCLILIPIAVAACIPKLIFLLVGGYDFICNKLEDFRYLFNDRMDKYIKKYDEKLDMVKQINAQERKMKKLQKKDPAHIYFVCPRCMQIGRVARTPKTESHTLNMTCGACHASAQLREKTRYGAFKPVAGQFMASC